MAFTLLSFTIVASVTVALTIAWRLRNRKQSLPVLVLAAVAGGLATAGIFWVALVGLFLVQVFEPWPLSLHQGPDTVFSRACYEEFLGEAQPADVTRVYCRKEWGFGGDSIYSIRFAFRAPSTVQAIVERLELDPVPAAERDRVRYLTGPGWWPLQVELSHARDVYQRNGIEFFWVDSESMEAFYQHANF
jgi:hypothetical protein